MDIRCFWRYIKNLNMNSAEFKKELCKLFTIKGFMCKGTHFYRNITDEVMIVFGLQHSVYGAYYYMEYGFHPTVFPFSWAFLTPSDVLLCR